MQLRTSKGDRDVHCEACKLHERCAHHMCQCRLIWHQCPIHRVDPAFHKSRKAPTTTQAKAKPQNKLSAMRPAPLSHSAPEKKRRTNTTGPYVEPVLYQASNIVASTNPPRNDLLVKVRHRHKAMLAARSAKKEPSLGEHQLPEAQTAPNPNEQVPWDHQIPVPAQAANQAITGITTENPCSFDERKVDPNYGKVPWRLMELL